MNSICRSLIVAMIVATFLFSCATTPATQPSDTQSSPEPVASTPASAGTTQSTDDKPVKAVEETNQSSENDAPPQEEKAESKEEASAEPSEETTTATSEESSLASSEETTEAATEEASSESSEETTEASEETADVTDEEPVADSSEESTAVVNEETSKTSNEETTEVTSEETSTASNEEAFEETGEETASASNEESSAKSNEETSSASSEETSEEDEKIAAAEAEEEETPEELEPVVVYILDRTMRLMANGVVDSIVEREYIPGTADLASETSYLSRNEVRSATQYNRHSDGSIEIVKTGSNGEIESIIVQAFDEDGLMLSEMQLDGSSQPLFTSTYAYQDGFLNVWDFTDRNGVLLSKALYMYSDGLVNRIYTYDMQGIPQEQIEIKYDRSGRKVDERIIDVVEAKELGHTTYRYNTDGLLAEKVQTGPGLFRKTRYQYDTNGNVLVESVLTRHDRITYILRHTYQTVTLLGGL